MKLLQDVNHTAGLPVHSHYRGNGRNTQNIFNVSQTAGSEFDPFGRQNLKSLNRSYVCRSVSQVVRVCYQRSVLLNVLCTSEIEIRHKNGWIHKFSNCFNNILFCDIIIKHSDSEPTQGETYRKVVLQRETQSWLQHT